MQLPSSATSSRFRSIICHRCCKPGHRARDCNAGVKSSPTRLDNLCRVFTKTSSKGGDQSTASGQVGLPQKRKKGDGRKLFISGLSYGIDENLLAEAFSQYGTIKKVNLIRDRHTKNSCGFGFIQYANVKCAKLAMEAMEGNTLAGRTIRVEQARRHGRSGRGLFGFSRLLCSIGGTPIQSRGEECNRVAKSAFGEIPLKSHTSVPVNAPCRGPSSAC
uniref:Uncharacterized protein n=1 Tax=Neogobius melanostomus TaxID=47308 RepID=A0A8C6WZX1_9GOBI